MELKTNDLRYSTNIISKIIFVEKFTNHICWEIPKSKPLREAQIIYKHEVISDAPYIIRSISTYQDVCVRVRLSTSLFREVWWEFFWSMTSRFCVVVEWDIWNVVTPGIAGMSGMSGVSGMSGMLRNVRNVENFRNVRTNIKCNTFLQPHHWAHLNEGGNFINGRNVITVRNDRNVENNRNVKNFRRLMSSDFKLALTRGRV